MDGRKKEITVILQKHHITLWTPLIHTLNLIPRAFFPPVSFLSIPGIKNGEVNLSQAQISHRTITTTKDCKMQNKNYITLKEYNSYSTSKQQIHLNTTWEHHIKVSVDFYAPM